VTSSQASQLPHLICEHRQCGSWLACDGGLYVGACPGLVIPFQVQKNLFFRFIYIQCTI
jgi:hypothetical protein